MRVASCLVLALLTSTALPAFAYENDKNDQWVFGMDEADQSADATDDTAWIYDFAAMGGVETLAKKGNKKEDAKPSQPTTSQPSSSQPSQNETKPVLVAVVDTGIDLDHSEFKGRITGGSCFGAAATCKGASAKGEDNNGHGTHVAGIIAGADDGKGNTGVAPNATLLAVKVLDANGSGPYTAVGQGITYAAQQGAKVINMSLGGASAASSLISPLQQAAKTAVIVAAAGNSGNQYAPGYPAAYATQSGIVGNMLIVGSVNSSNKISSFSQTPGDGGCVNGVCFKDYFVVAPGEKINSAAIGGGYTTMSGTSMATPYVSGVAARVLEQSPYLTPKEVVGIILDSATDLGDRGVDAVYGHGLVNLNAALAPVGNQSIATGGNSVLNFATAGSVQQAVLAGLLAVPVRASSLAQNIVIFDKYHRDYKVDLADKVSAPKTSILPMIDNDGLFRSVSFKGLGFTATGFVADIDPSMVEFAGHDTATRTELKDLVVTSRLTDDVSVSIGRDAELGGRLNQLDLAAGDQYTGLFMSASAMNSPFLVLTSDATFLSTAVKLGDGLTFSAGHASSESDADAVLADGVMTADEAASYFNQDTTHLRSAENTAAAFSWQFADWGTAGATFAQTSEANSLLGTTEQGALALTAESKTTSIGLGARFDLGDNWTASASYSRGQTEAAPAANGIIKSFSGIESEAYGVAVAKKGVFGKQDSVGFAVTRPLHITSGSATMMASTGVTSDREIVYGTEVVDLARTTPETDYEVGYTARLNDNLTLQANAMVQTNVGGEAGRTGVAGFVTLKGTW